MANTTNIDLVKPAGTDHALVSVINQNSDKIDAFAGKTNTGLASVQDGIAIVADGDTHAAIASGQFVYVKNHSTLAEGLYRATAAIATDAALSTSNLAADASGGMNALKADLDTLNSNLNTIKEITNFTLATGISADNLRVYQVGKIVVISGGVASADSSPVAFSHGQALLTGLPAPNDARRVFMGLTFEGAEQRHQYRLMVISGEVQAFWDTVTVPKSGYGLYLNVVYTTNQ